VRYNRFGGRFDKYKPQTSPPPTHSRDTTASGECSTDTRNSYHFNGSNFKRYKEVPPKSQPCMGGRFERYATYKNAHERREDAEILPFLDSRTDGEETKVKYGTIDWDVAPPQEYWDELFRVSKNQIIWGGNYFALPPTRCFVIWRKLTISESFSMAMAEYAWTSFFGNAKVFECAPQGNAKEPRIHACQKPVALYQFLLKHFAKQGDKIFDSHLGSQSSRIAAYGMGYDFYGCEVDETYFKQGCERFERVCHGVEKTRDGRTLHQLSLFD